MISKFNNIFKKGFKIKALFLFFLLLCFQVSAQKKTAKEKVSVTFEVYDRKKNLIQSLVFDGKVEEEIQAQYKDAKAFQCDTKGYFMPSQFNSKKHYFVTMNFSCTVSGTTQNTEVKRIIIPVDPTKKTIRKINLHKDLPELWFKVKEINQ